MRGTASPGPPLLTGFVLERLGGGGAGASLVTGDFVPLVGELELNELNLTGFRGTTGFRITVPSDDADVADSVDACDADRLGTLPATAGWYVCLLG